MSRRTALGVVVIGAIVGAIGVWPAATARALSPDSAPPLPAPSGSVINVSTVAGLQAAVTAVTSNQTIVIAPGTYHLTSTLWVNGSKANVTIRGGTNNRNDVVLVGQGMGVASSAVPFGIWTGSGVTNITIANLTIRDIYQHPIMLNPGTQSPRIYNVRLLDGGEQLIKANPDGSGGGVNNGIVEYSVLEYTSTAPNYYTNGVDVHTGRDWIIRHNLFRRIRAPQGELAGPAVLMWNGSSGSVVEGNTFIDCHRDISLGLIERVPNDHTGGIVRNNFIIRTAGSGGDVAIAVFDSPGTKVVHNTILMNGQYPNSIEARFTDTTGVTIVNNLSDRPALNRDGASSTMPGNVWTAASNWFASPVVGDLHLTAAGASALDRGVSTSDAPVDWDGQARPSGAAPDAGADEYGAASSGGDTTAPSVSLTAPSNGAVVSGSTPVSATASDNVGVASVQFTLNGAALGAPDTSAPYGITWNTIGASNGSYVLRATARDAAGNTTTSSARTVTVSNPSSDTTRPTAILTSPAAGSTVSGVATLQAAATDNVGVVGVRFILDGVQFGAEDTAAPYEVSWNTATSPDGAHGIQLIARDAAGNFRYTPATMITVANASDPAVTSRRDLNGDGRTDLLFQHTSGQLYAWFMNGSVRSGGAPLTPATMPTAWQAVGVDDFSRDGRGDVLWQHRTTGQPALWIMDGTRRVIETAIAGGAPSVWRIAATGDVNGDGHTDIIWQHPATGLTKVWLMWYWSLISEAGLTPYRADPNWRLAGAADFDGDGRDDLVWQHLQTGQLSVWYMGPDGRTTTNVRTLSSRLATPGWLIKVVADFNGDGAPDLIWHRQQTGQLSVWMLNGTTLVHEAGLTPLQIDPAWSLAAGR